MIDYVGAVAEVPAMAQSLQVENGTLRLISKLHTHIEILGQELAAHALQDTKRNDGESGAFAFTYSIRRRLDTARSKDRWTEWSLLFPQLVYLRPQEDELA
ncbi:hypothetical protein E4U17_007444 [Claviceps sp. LM77 group G4]|nr:hypothetical protein E4U17_007444 [Claviceps sp. LM77 group G4]